MELNTKVSELEDELKILKAEVRNVLLDIREAILERANPLSDQHEAAFLRMDLNTTSRAIAAEAAAAEARHSVEQAAAQSAGGRPSVEEPAEEKPEGKPEGRRRKRRRDEAESERPRNKAGDGNEPSTPEEGTVEASYSAEDTPDEASLEDISTRPAPIPPMYRASQAPGGSASDLATWVVDAISDLGPDQLERVIAVHRLCGGLPPNVSEALSQLQELTRDSEGELHWLRVLRDLDRIAGV